MFCERCGKEDSSVEAAFDPFLVDMFDEFIEVNLCEDCAVDLKNEV